MTPTLSPYCIEASRLFNSWRVKVDPTRKRIVDDTIRQLKACGAWDRMEWLCVYAAHDATDALRNWKDPGVYDSTLNNAPTFVADHGYFCIRSGAHNINTNFIPASSIRLATKTEMHYAFFNYSHDEAQRVDMGSTGSTSSDYCPLFYKWGSDFSDRCNSSDTRDWNIGHSAGHAVTQLTGGSGTKYSYYDGIKITDAFDVSGGLATNLSDQPVYIGTWNSNGSSSGHDADRGYSYAHIGRPLSDAQVGDIRRIMRDYLNRLVGPFSPGTTSLLLHFDGSDADTTFTDSGPTGHTMTAHGNAALDTGVTPKFGTASMILDGTGDWLDTPTDHADFNFGTGDFNIDCWYLKTADFSDGKPIFACSQSNAASNLLIRTKDNGGGLNGFSALSNDGGNEQLTGDMHDIVANSTWHHVCLKRRNGFVRFYINGKMMSQPVTDTTDYNLHHISIGAAYDGTNAIIGNIDEFRVVKGSHAGGWWGFDVPTAAY